MSQQLRKHDSAAPKAQSSGSSRGPQCVPETPDEGVPGAGGGCPLQSLPRKSPLCSPETGSCFWSLHSRVRCAGEETPLQGQGGVWLRGSMRSLFPIFSPVAVSHTSLGRDSSCRTRTGTQALPGDLRNGDLPPGSLVYKPLRGPSAHAAPPGPRTAPSPPTHRPPRPALMRQ